MSYAPTPSAGRALDFIRRYMGEHEHAPSHAEIAAGIGLKSKGQIAGLLEQLVERGHIRRKRYRRRCIELLTSKTRAPLAETAPHGSGPVFDGVGPWALGIERAEQVRRLEALYKRLERLGWGGERVTARRWVSVFLADPRASEGCLRALNELPSTDRRKLLFSQFS